MMEIIEQRKVSARRGECERRLTISYKYGTREYRYWVAASHRVIEKVDMQVVDNGLLVKCELDTYLPEKVEKALNAWFDEQKILI
jgi:hypothetical protein